MSTYLWSRSVTAIDSFIISQNTLLLPSALTFSLEGEVAVGAVIGPYVRVGADVFTEHAGLLAADPTLLTDVFTSTPPTHVHILFVRFESARLTEEVRNNQCIKTKQLKSLNYLIK